MIIYGSKATEVATADIPDKCPHCGNIGSIQMSVFQKYAHIFWIPFFPTTKTGVTQCSHCNQVLNKKEFTVSLKNHFEIVKLKSKTPIWTFIGLVIFIALMAWGLVRNKQNSERNARIILSPQKGDIYEVKEDSKQYTLYKVDNVIDDSVFLLVNQYEVNKSSGLADLKVKGDDAYNDEILVMTKADLRDMLDKGEIIGIDRK